MSKTELELEHSVKGRRKKDGGWELVAPEVYNVTSGWWIFKGTYKEPREPLGRLDAAVKAQQAFDTGIYQDVIVERFNGSDSDGNLYCNSVVWKNGKWCNYHVDGVNLYEA